MTSEGIYDRSDRHEQQQRRRFDRLCDEHGAGVYRFCLRLCDGRAADAEDLAQEALVAAFTGLPRFAGRSSLKTWLYRIVLYQWRRTRRAEGMADGSPRVTVLGDVEPSSTDRTAAHIERLSLNAAVDRLPDSLREAVLLVKMEGMTYREAAAVLEVPQGTVQSRVHDAMKRLRELLSEDENEVSDDRKQGLMP